MNALPLLRLHSCIPRISFCRWLADLCYHIPTHAAFLLRMREFWGPMPGLISSAEGLQWNLRSKPLEIPTPHVRGLDDVMVGWPFGLLAEPPDRGAGIPCASPHIKRQDPSP